jgi:hypothetical protein
MLTESEKNPLMYVSLLSLVGFKISIVHPKMSKDTKILFRSK